MFDGVNGERNRGQHEQNSRNRGRFRKRRGCAARAKRGLTPLSAEGCRNVPSLPALQQYNDNQKQANNHVNDGDKDDEHEIYGPKLFRMSALMRKKIELLNQDHNT